MSFYNFALQSILFMATVLNLAEPRKYDVELDALKLYGEDLRSVLQRFRKTPDYLKILREKMNELNHQYNFIAMQTLTHYASKLKDKVTVDLGLETFETINLTTTPATSSNFYRGHQDFRRNTEVTVDDMDPVQKLDTYNISGTLTFAERNGYRDLGFEFAGHTIHAIIKHMSSDDEPAKSTLLPYEGDHDSHQKTTSTTPHEHVHEVTTSSDTEKSTAAAETSIADSFKYRYRRPRK